MSKIMVTRKDIEWLKLQLATNAYKDILHPNIQLGLTTIAEGTMELLTRYEDLCLRETGKHAVAHEDSKRLAVGDRIVFRDLMNHQRRCYKGEILSINSDGTYDIEAYFLFGKNPVIQKVTEAEFKREKE